MSIFTVTTRITRQYLERKTKSDLAQMYLDLLDYDMRLEARARAVVEWEREYRTINHLGSKSPDCFQALADILPDDHDRYPMPEAERQAKGEQR